MSKPLIVYWSSNSGGTRRVAEALSTDTVELADYDGTSPYVLMTPTYDQPRGGFTPKPVQTFLEEYAHLMVGVLGLGNRSEEHTSELQSRFDLVCRLLLEKKNT